MKRRRFLRSAAAAALAPATLAEDVRRPSEGNITHSRPADHGTYTDGRVCTCIACIPGAETPILDSSWSLTSTAATVSQGTTITT